MEEQIEAVKLGHLCSIVTEGELIGIPLEMFSAHKMIYTCTPSLQYRPEALYRIGGDSTYAVLALAMIYLETVKEVYDIIVALPFIGIES